MSLPTPASRLPDVGTTIFTIMSEAAARHDAINLSQGFPSFEPPAPLLERVEHHLRAGHNQYAPMGGVPALTRALAEQVGRLQSRELDPYTEITITAGATEGLFCGIQAVLHPGDEAVLLDPAYDAYAPVVRLAGARPIHVPMAVAGAGRFSVDWDRLGAALTARTRLVVINFPHNPTGAILDRDDLERLAAMLRDTQAILLADEVYEHIVFDGRSHVSVLSNEELFERSMVVSSFGKSLHATGWKIGYCAAPARLTQEFRKIHQFANFAVSTPMQYAIADYITAYPDFAVELAKFYEAKRDVFLNALAGSRFDYVPARSTFFQLLDYSAISDTGDDTLAMQWTRTPGVASIPVSVFCEHPLDARLLRFCFAKDDATLVAAAEKLGTL
ncbi:MAG: methionine aminotransferase [Woeseiaceae bacterium]|jgi:methionine aminotransferase|nr:methionine aminotransferase [Woeseiaceae bacterium]